MGPIPRRSFIVEALPLRGSDRLIHAISRLVRRLPHRLVRIVLLFDLAFCVIPFWAWFVYRRWTGRWPDASEMRKLQLRGFRFGLAHIRHHSEGTGAFQIDWGSAPIRNAKATERQDYEHRGSCMSCRNCCTTTWLPPAEQLTCPLLGPEGCRIYGGVYWDYFNCGRYPYRPKDTQAYGCPRFEGPLEVPDVLPAEVGAEATWSHTLRQENPTTGAPGRRA